MFPPYSMLEHNSNNNNTNNYTTSSSSGRSRSGSAFTAVPILAAPSAAAVPLSVAHIAHFGLVPATVPVPVPMPVPVPVAEMAADASASLENMLHSHRRKMQRRAANRRSAQLSRARKKAQVEDLRSENVRLQRLADILDSQPQLVFCVDAGGKITFVSEKTLSFVQLQSVTSSSSSLASSLISPFLSAPLEKERERGRRKRAGSVKEIERERERERESEREANEDEPKHLSQLLCADSTATVLRDLQRLREAFLSQNSQEMDLSMLFFTQDVFFLDTAGHRVSGSLRCSKVQRRTPAVELEDEREREGPPATKKTKTAPLNDDTTTTSSSSNKKKNNDTTDDNAKNNSTSDKNNNNRVSGANNNGNGAIRAVQAISPSSLSISGTIHTHVHVSNNNDTSKVSPGSANLSNFQLLADCVSSLVQAHEANNKSDNSNNNTNNNGRSIAGEERDSNKSSATTESALSGGSLNDLAALAASSEDAPVEEEYVCVIHMRDAHIASFVPTCAAAENGSLSSMSSKTDLRFFLSSPVLSAFSIEVHNAREVERQRSGVASGTGEIENAESSSLTRSGSAASSNDPSMSASE